MAATTKTLTPTNQQISIPAFTDKPDNRLQTDSTGKLADAVNALADQVSSICKKITTAKTVTVPANDKLTDQRAFFTLPSGYTVVSVVPTATSAEMFCITIGNIYEAAGENNSYISFGIRNFHTGELERDVYFIVLAVKSTSVS